MLDTRYKSANWVVHLANGNTRRFYDSMGYVYRIRYDIDKAHTSVSIYNRFEIDRISPDFEDDDEWIDEGESDLPSDYSILSLRIVA